MRYHPERPRDLLARVDPARLLAGWPVGLRDGALLALLAAGLTAEELAALHASEITMERGNLIVHVPYDDVAWAGTLPPHLGGRLLSWLTESRLWATPEPIALGLEGPLTPQAIRQILRRYRKGKTR